MSECCISDPNRCICKKSHNQKFDGLDNFDDLDVMEFGIVMGWWEEFDRKGPIKVHRVNKADFNENATMANVLVGLSLPPNTKLFDSVSSARKNGWNKPIVVGEVHLINKGRIKVIIK